MSSNSPSSEEGPLHPRHALAAGLIGALLGLLVSSLSGCEGPIACDAGSSTTCPPDQVCDAREQVCVDVGGDGDGDGDGPCEDGCAPATLVESFEGAAAAATRSGAMASATSTAPTRAATSTSPTCPATPAACAPATAICS